MATIAAGPATMVSTQREAGFAFVPVNSSGKTQPKDRKTIRSHCMRGKNRRIGVPRRPTARAIRTSPDWRPALPGDNGSSTITLSGADQDIDEDRSFFAKANSNSILSFYTPSNTAQVELAIDMDDATKALVIDCMPALRSHTRGLERY